jgi:hypothetical protein
MFHDLLKGLSRLGIGHVVEQRHRPVEFSLTGGQARDGEVDDTKRLLPMAMHLTMYDACSDERQNNHKHECQDSMDTPFKDHGISCYDLMFFLSANRHHNLNNPDVTQMIPQLHQY